MLEAVLRHIHNRFECGSWSGTFEVSDGSLPLDLQEGQYYWIEGSVFNDGLHQWPYADLTDEAFDGKVVAMAVPRQVVEIAEDVCEWCQEHGNAAPAYQSETFDGYSYTLGEAKGWQDAFAARLNPYRKLESWQW